MGWGGKRGKITFMFLFYLPRFSNNFFLILSYVLSLLLCLLYRWYGAALCCVFVYLSTHACSLYSLCIHFSIPSVCLLTALMACVELGVRNTHTHKPSLALGVVSLELVCVCSTTVFMLTGYSH